MEENETVRRLSPEGREKIAAAQRKRWAKYRRDKRASAGSKTSGSPKK